MIDQCTLPDTVPVFDYYLIKGQPMAVSEETTESCKEDLEEKDKEQCQSFTSWTQYTASICGSLGTAAQIVNRAVGDKKTAMKIILSIKTVYDVVSGVNEQFLIAIKDINKGEPYKPVPKPEPIPPFPMPSDDKDVEQAVVSAWRAFKPWLERAITSMDPESPWVKVLLGIIESSDQMIKDLQDLFREFTD